MSIIWLKNFTNKLFYLFFLSFILSCKSDDKNNQLFQLVEPAQSGILFKNLISESDTLNVLEFLNLYTGGGVATGDINNDGLEDLFFTGNMTSSKLYLNKSEVDDLIFDDITEAAGVVTDQWMTGVTMIDINQDGLLDIYICSSGGKDKRERTNRLFINQGLEDGVPKFRESAKEYGIDDTSYATQAAFLDYDNDGDLDLFIISNYSEDFFGNKQNMPTKKIVEFDEKKADKLYKNYTSERKEIVDSDTLPLFKDVTKEAGIIHFGYSLGIATSDINNDGWTDIYIANDFLSNDILYINNGDGTFSDKASTYFNHTSYASMGVDIADFNNDGKTDVAVVDMIPEDNVRMKSMLPASNYSTFLVGLRNGYYPQFSRNTLQLNNGKNHVGDISFSEIGRLAGIHHTDWSWSVLFADFDNDGWKDLFITNGFKRDLQDLDFVRYFDWPFTLTDSKDDRKTYLDKAHKVPGVNVPNYIFHNAGDLGFKNMSRKWGFDKPSLSNGAVFCDLDNDGDLDLIVNNVDDYPFLFKNTLRKKSKNNFLKIKFKGKDGNIDGIGARVWVKTDSTTQYYENYPVKGFQSSMHSGIHIGLGSKTIDELVVVWPDGKNEILNKTDINKDIILEYGNASDLVKQAQQDSKVLFKEVSDIHNLNYKHEEYDFVDFNYHRLIPFKLSQNGPGMAVGDIDNDGLDDFYIGGAKNFSGNIFRQGKDSKFKKFTFEGDANFEDQGALFFDADNDGDSDLYVVSGSVEMGDESEFYQDRLYINDSKGNFQQLKSALPEFPISGSCIIAADFDQDGDLDLFIGGRSVPGKYPLPQSSKLLLNITSTPDQPIFKDVTDEYLPELNDLGMVTASLWSDYNNDGWMDLLIVGEGMYITIFENKNARFKNESKKIINNTTGYWNSIAAADFDSDGFMDYVVGNLGRNSILKASPEQPVRIYVKDFDQNGFIDPIVSHYIQGKNVPLHSRDEFIDQFSGMRGRFLKYSDYAALTTEEIFQKEDFDDAYTLTYENFETSILKNDKGKKLSLRSLPVDVQLSQTFGVLADDFDEDGIPDIMITGNSYAPTINLGWNDASVGMILKGLGNGDFKPLKPEESGFYANKDVKSTAKIYSASNEPLVLIAKNSDSLSTFSYDVKNSSIVLLNPLDAWAEIEYKNGKKEKREFYYGSGYLSQSSRKMMVLKEAKSITIHDFLNNKRNISFQTISSTK